MYIVTRVIETPVPSVHLVDKIETTDEYTIVGTLKEAKAQWKAWLKEDGTYTAQYGMIMESSDPHHETAMEDYQEIYYEVVDSIVASILLPKKSVIKYYMKVGRPGLYELAKKWTTQFIEDNDGHEWGVDDDREFLEEIELFCEEQIKFLK